MFLNNWKKELCTIPNLLSLLRLALIPVYMTIYLKGTLPRDFYLAGAILALSCLTDLLDGWIARRFHMTTNLGKILDPAADKATQFAVILGLSVRYAVMRPVLVLFVIKESLQLTAMIISVRRGECSGRTLIAGKICTAVLFVSLIILVLFPDAPSTVIATAAAVDLVALGGAFLCYAICFLPSGTQ